MADLTQEIPLTREWQDITTAGSLVAGSSYSGSIIGVDAPVTVHQAVTDDGNPPSAGITGHPWVANPARRDTSPGRRLTATAGQRLWLRASTSATLVLTRV